jgi:hypothetical protein
LIRGGNEQEKALFDVCVKKSLITDLSWQMPQHPDLSGVAASFSVSGNLYVSDRMIDISNVPFNNHKIYQR